MCPVVFARAQRRAFTTATSRFLSPCVSVIPLVDPRADGAGLWIVPFRGAVLSSEVDDLNVSDSPGGLFGEDQLQVGFRHLHALPTREAPPLGQSVDVGIHGERHKSAARGGREGGGSVEVRRRPERAGVGGARRERRRVGLSEDDEVTRLGANRRNAGDAGGWADGDRVCQSVHKWRVGITRASLGQR